MQHELNINYSEYKQVIKLLLLRLVRLVYLGMCPGVQTHIYPYMSKMSFIIENWWRDQRTMFTIGPMHTRDNDQGYCSAEPEYAAKHT